MFFVALIHSLVYLLFVMRAYIMFGDIVYNIVYISMMHPSGSLRDKNLLSHFSIYKCHNFTTIITIKNALCLTIQPYFKAARGATSHGVKDNIWFIGGGRQVAGRWWAAEGGGGSLYTCLKPC